MNREIIVVYARCKVIIFPNSRKQAWENLWWSVTTCGSHIWSLCSTFVSSFNTTFDFTLTLIKPWYINTLLNYLLCIQNIHTSVNDLLCINTLNPFIVRAKPGMVTCFWCNQGPRVVLSTHTIIYHLCFAKRTVSCQTKDLQTPLHEMFSLLFLFNLSVWLCFSCLSLLLSNFRRT